MTDEELKQLVASLALDQKELTKKMIETEEQMHRNDEAFKEKLNKIGELVGNIGQNQGDVAEEFFFNSLKAEIRLGSIRFEDISRSERKVRGQTEEEYDIVMTNGNAIGIVEVKYKAHQNDLQKLERKMRNFKKLFPWFKDYKLYGAVASFHINKDAKREALQRGFFVLERSGNVIHTECGENLLVL